jgi:hypothetical protein
LVRRTQRPVAPMTRRWIMLRFFLRPDGKP